MKTAAEYFEEVESLSKVEIISERFGVKWKDHTRKHFGYEELLEMAHVLGRKTVLYEKIIENQTVFSDVLTLAKEFEKRCGIDIQMEVFSDGSFAVKDIHGAFLKSGNDISELLTFLRVEDWNAYLLAEREAIAVLNESPKKRKPNRYEVRTTTGTHKIIEAYYNLIVEDKGYTALQFYCDDDVVASFSTHTIESIIKLN